MPIPTKLLISDLLKERASWSRLFGIEESRTIYNWLILHHIKGLKTGRKTLKFDTSKS